MSGAAAAGYSGRALWQKLGLKPGLRILALDPPRDYAELVGLPPGDLQRVGPRAAFDLVHVFASRRNELEAALQRLSARLPQDGLLWVSWPKKASRVPTDISEDAIRELALPLGLVDIKVCAVDAVWSGLKLVWRREYRAKMQQATAR
jgi:hypothetical protein